LLKLKTFWNKIDTTNSCWNWLASKTNLGYGQIWIKGRYVYAHRFVYELFKGKIPEGLEIDHLCRNTSCGNPNHLEAVTHKVNAQRGNSGLYNILKTHCPRGHEYTKENTMFYKNLRKCRECHKIHCKESQRRNKLIN